MLVSARMAKFPEFPAAQRFRSSLGPNSCEILEILGNLRNSQKMLSRPGLLLRGRDVMMMMIYPLPR